MHSADRSWWWDGATWQPAVSPDGKAWFDGTSWQSAKPENPAAKAFGCAAGAVLGVIALFVIAPVALFVLYAWVSSGAHEYRGLDDDRILRAAAGACAELSVELEALSGDRADDIDQGNASIDGLVETMMDLGEGRLRDDEPALDWVDDWRRLGNARTSFAVALRTGHDEPFTIPQTTDGFPISDRMIDLGPPECERAVQLAISP